MAANKNLKVEKAVQPPELLSFWTESAVPGLELQLKLVLGAVGGAELHRF